MMIKKNTLILFTLLIGLIHISMPAHAKERIYVLAGQSNMMGKGRTNKLPDVYHKTPSNVIFFYQGRSLNLASYNVFGPEIGFAHTVAKAYPNDTHIIVKFVATGSIIEQWLPGTPLYKGMLRQLSYATTNKDFKVDAVVWMQGEGDAKNKQLAHQYENRLKYFIQSLRNTLKSPESLFILGQINPEDPAYSMTPIVREAQEKIQSLLPNTFMVSTEKIGKIYDHVHYNAQGQLELGKRFALAYVNNKPKIIN